MRPTDLAFLVTRAGPDVRVEITHTPTGVVASATASGTGAESKARERALAEVAAHLGESS